jgi:hypothetical protein
MAQEGRGARRGARFAVRFNDEWWRRDLIGSDPEGRAVARRARERYEREGVAPTELRACLADGPDGTELSNCVKAYLGAPAVGEPYGIVLVADVIAGRLVLRFLAFGERHPRPGVQSVYQRAHKRLHGRYPDR